MGKKHGHDHPEAIPHHDYEAQLRELQIGLSRLQRHLLEAGRQVLVIFEGRDAAGKDGVIKRIVENLSPRETRVVALGVPTEIERREWYFQRWLEHLPLAGEIALFNRSWYNRAGVERVMGFCTETEVAGFYQTVPLLEQLLVQSGITLVKYYLDISRKEQKHRLRERAEDPLKQWKISPVDERAQKKWKAFSAARDEMLARTHSAFAPWTVVIRDLLHRLAPESPACDAPDPAILFTYDAGAVDEHRLAK
jgi:polyphosphate kinase 2